MEDEIETVKDGLDFTPPDTPSQHYHPTPMEGGEMGTSPSKDDAGGAATGDSQMMSQGGVLASLGPTTSPPNPTLVGGSGGSGDVGARDDTVVAGAAAADDDDEDRDYDKDYDGEITSASIDYNQDTVKFVPSATSPSTARASAFTSNANEHDGDNNNSNEEDASAPAAQGGDCMSPLTMTEDQRERRHDEEEEENDDEEEEEEMEINSEDEASIAQDGIYQPADGIAVGTIVGGGSRSNQDNRDDQADDSDDDDSDDDEEFGSMEAPFADTGGLLTQGGGFGADSDEDESSSDGNLAREAEGASDDESNAEGWSQDLLARVDDVADEGHAHAGQEGSATEPPASAPSDTEQTATADELGASTAVVEAEAMDVDTGMFVTGLTEQSETQPQPVLADGAANTNETGEDGNNFDGATNENGGGHCDNNNDDDGEEPKEEEEEEDIDDGDMVEGLTEQTKALPAFSADSNSQGGAGSDVAAGAAADTSEEVPASPCVATPLVEAEIAGLTEQSEWSQQDSQKTEHENSQPGEGDARSTKDIATHGSNADDDESSAKTAMDAQTSAAQESLDAVANNAAKAATVGEAHSPRQLLSDADLMPPPGTPHRRSPKKNHAAEAEAGKSPSQRSLANNLAEGSEDTYDSFGDLPVFSGDTEQMVIPSMDRFTAKEDSPAVPGSSQQKSELACDKEQNRNGADSPNKGETSGTATGSEDIVNSQVEKKGSPTEDVAEMLPSEDGMPSPRRESQTENVQNDDTDEAQEGTGASTSSAAVLGDLYDNAETERFQGSAGNRECQYGARSEEVDTNASTPLVSHTQTYIEGPFNDGFSYPRNDELGLLEEKKVHSPPPAVAANPLQDFHVHGPKDSQQDGAEDMDIGASMRSVDEEVVAGGPAQSMTPSSIHQSVTKTPSSSKNNRSGDVSPAGAGLESGAATVVLSTTPACSKKMARDPLTPVTAASAAAQAQASEATTVRLSATPSSTKKGPECVAESDIPTKEIDTTSPPPSSKKPTTPASSERTAADSASSPNKSGLSISSSPHSQPLLSPGNDAPAGSNIRNENSSLLKSAEASNKAVAKHGHLEGGKGLSQDDIVDSDEDTCEESGHLDAITPRPLQGDAGVSHHEAPGAADKKESANSESIQKGKKEEKEDNAGAKFIPVGATNSSAGKRSPAPPARWIHKHQKSNQKKNSAADDARVERDIGESEEEEEFDVDGGSEPTPRLFLPSNVKQRAAERQKELEHEADAFSSSDDDGLVARNGRAAAVWRHNNNPALQDTQDSPSESEGEEALVARKEIKPITTNAQTLSARKRPKKRLNLDAYSDKEVSQSLVASREGKRDIKRKSSSDYNVQDSLAMLDADASKHESSDEGEEKFQVDGISDDASVSSSDYDIMPSQNTIDIDNLIGQARGALQKFSERKSDSQVAQLKRKVERQEKKYSKLKDGYNKVRAENAVLKRSLEKKITQNQEMKVLLAKFNKMAQAGSLPVIDDGNGAASSSESDSSIDSQTAPPPAKKKAKKSVSAPKTRSASKRQANRAGAPLAASATTAPIVVPPSSIKARGRSQTTTSSSTCGKKKRRKEQKKSRPTDESSDDENTTLANLDTTRKAKMAGKKLNFERHNTGSRSKGTEKMGKSPSDNPNSATLKATRGRSRSRRGISNRDMIPKGMEHIRPLTIWNYLEARGWTWRSGPEPYNNVYVRPGIEHLNVVGINQDFFEDGNYLYAEAKKAGFVVKSIEDIMEEGTEEEVGDIDSDATNDDGGYGDGDSAAEEASIHSGQRGHRRSGYAQKQVNAATSPTGARASLSVGKYSADEQDEDDEDEYKDEGQQQDSPSEQENFDAESNAGESSSEGEEESAEESEDDNDDVIASLDDTALCGDARILTPRSLHLCAKLIRNFAKLRNDASFMNLLWKPMWDLLKDGQGGKDKEDLRWGWAKSKGMLAQHSYWYVAPQSKGSGGKQGVDYFETEEAVVLKILQEIQQIDPSLFDPSLEKTEAFETVLRRAVENNVAFSESRSNPDIGAGRRNRRKTHDESPFVYSAREKKARASPAKTKTKKVNAASSSKPKQISSLKIKQTPSPQKVAKSVVFSDPPLLSQNTMEGVETLLRLNASGPAPENAPTRAKATAAATPDEANGTQALNRPLPSYEDIVTPKGIEALRAARLQSLQDVTPSPKKRSASPASAAKSSVTYSGRKRQKTRSPAKDEAPSSIDTRLSQVPYQLCDSLDDMSQSQSDASSTFTRRKSIKHGNDGKVLPLCGLSFFGSGLDTKHADIIKALGGEYLSDVSALDDATIYGSLFFVSNVQQRRKIKYILASALGVPMLHYSWLKAIQSKYVAIEESNKDDGKEADAIKQLPYNSDLFKAMRLPVGLSIKTGLYQLQKARHAKRWCRPGQENGKLVFKGLKLTVALENSKFESQWEAILRAAGATIVKSSSLKSGKKCQLDALLVDRNSLPPHTTAVPFNISRCMNFVKKGNAKTTDGIAKIPIVDLSWALQCIVEREQLAWDADKRYILYSDASTASNEHCDAMYEMKVKIDNDPVRFECGDIVEFGRTKSTERIGRIVNIEVSKRTCAARHLEIQLLDRNGNFELVDGGEDATRVRINENELRRHITLLGAKDFKDIRKGGYLPATEKETHIFLQKKPPSAPSK